MNATETNLKVITTENLRELIAETQQTLDELTAELERREDVAQHHEIANLENHMKSAQLSLKTIRDFLAYLVDDMRSQRKEK